jgi:signal transduction histidine kinase
MRRLLVRYGLAMTSVVLVAFLVPLGLLARSLAQDAALDRARQDAQSVAVFAGGSTEDRTRLEAEVLRVNGGVDGTGRRTTVFLPDGAVVGEAGEPTAATELASLGRAFVARADGGMEVVLPVAGASGTSVVRTFVPDAELSRGVARAWAVLLAVGAVLLAGTALAGDRLAARLSRSVLDLSGVADRLGAGDLAARVEPSGPPEVASVGRVLNGLGARVARLLAAERELVADLSHRLRTPMTALRLDVELLADPRERARLTDHVDELVRAVDTVVRSARDPERETPAAVCDAAGVVRDRARFWGVLAVEQGRPLHTDVPESPVPIALPDGELGAALDVLVDNVFSHTPTGTGFTLSVDGGGAPGGPVRIEVADDGPGFDPRLVERGRSGAGSTGLGLDVARRAAQDAGGRLVVEARDGGGVRVVLEVPRREVSTA